MKIKKIIASLLAISMLLPINNLVINAESGIDEEWEERKKAADEPTTSEEFLKVQEVINNYIISNKNGDYETLVENYDYDIIYYIVNGTYATNEEILADEEFCEEYFNNGNEYQGRIVVTEPICLNSKAYIFQKFLRSKFWTYISEDEENPLTPDKYFNIDGLYQFRMYSGKYIPEDPDYDSPVNSQVDTYVFRINGEWKVDQVITLYRAFSGFVMPNYVEGDVNDDGEFNVLDVVTLQKWILNDGTKLENWEAADFYDDGVIDVFDLVLMKRALLNGDK